MSQFPDNPFPNTNPYPIVPANEPCNYRPLTIAANYQNKDLFAVQQQPQEPAYQPNIVNQVGFEIGYTDDGVVLKQNLILGLSHTTVKSLVVTAVVAGLMVHTRLLLLCMVLLLFTFV